jgi:hypothetical protein
VMDLNQDGVVEREEIAEAIVRRTSEPASPITIELLLKAVDTNRDNVVSPDEDRAARAIRLETSWARPTPSG